MYEDIVNKLKARYASFDPKEITVDSIIGTGLYEAYFTIMCPSGIERTIHGKGKGLGNLMASISRYVEEELEYDEKHARARALLEQLEKEHEITRREQVAAWYQCVIRFNWHSINVGGDACGIILVAKGPNAVTLSHGAAVYSFHISPKQGKIVKSEYDRVWEFLGFEKGD